MSGGSSGVPVSQTQLCRLHPDIGKYHAGEAAGSCLQLLAQRRIESTAWRGNSVVDSVLDPHSVSRASKREVRKRSNTS
jgi:hypothetical protein